MTVCRVGSIEARAARTATVFPVPTSPVMTPRVFSVMVQVMRAAASAWEAWRCGVQVAGQGCGAAASVFEEDGGGLDGEGGVLAAVVAEAPGGERAVEVAGDLGQGLAEPGGGQVQGAEDVVGGRWLVQAGGAVRGPVQAADGLGGGAGQGDGVGAGELV